MTWQREISLAGLKQRIRRSTRRPSPPPWPCDPSPRDSLSGRLRHNMVDRIETYHDALPDPTQRKWRCSGPQGSCYARKRERTPLSKIQPGLRGANSRGCPSLMGVAVGTVMGPPPGSASAAPAAPPDPAVEPLQRRLPFGPGDRRAGARGRLHPRRRAHRLHQGPKVRRLHVRGPGAAVGAESAKPKGGVRFGTPLIAWQNLDRPALRRP